MPRFSQFLWVDLSYLNVFVRFLPYSRFSLVFACERGSQRVRSVSTWADDVKHEKAYQWSAPLHFIDTKDYACNYDYE
jgi:hypothetical protein